MPGKDGAYASFGRTHEARLVRSLVSETGLSPATAASVAATVLPAAYDRSFASDGAAYGWLRVAARHLAADAADWAGAADAALVTADRAAAALADLPAAERELLRLRYVDGLLPDALAALLGTTVAEVAERLDHARDAATRAATATLPAERAVSVPRAVAAAAAAAVAIVTSFGTPSPTLLGSPDVQAGSAPLALDLVRPATGSEPVPAYSGGDVTPRPPATTVAVAEPRVVAPRAPVEDDDPGKPGGGKSVQKIVVTVPAGVGDVEVPKDVPFSENQARVCEIAPEPPAVARCERDSG